MAASVSRPAPEFSLDDVAGVTHRSDDFRGHWLLLVFHRHLAWLPCREHLLQLQQQADEIDRLDVKVCVVTFEQKFIVDAYVRETNTPWPILIDSQRTLYTAYGMHRGRMRDVLGLRSWWIYLKLLAKGRRPHRTQGDVFQLGGDVLVDPAGMVRLRHVGSGPADRPEVNAILDIVRNVTHD